MEHNVDVLIASGESVLPLWSVMMRLLEDEDDDVRRTVATVIARLRSNIPAHFKGMPNYPSV